MNEQEIIKKYREEKLNGEIKSPTLKRADDIIHGERQDQYGNPEDSFARIAEYWNCYLGEMCCESCRGLDSKDVAILLALMKIARMSGQQWHPDNPIDVCGYMAILNDRIKSDP